MKLLSRFVFLAAFAATPAAGYSGGKITVNAHSVEVREVLNMIAEVSGMTVIASDTVGGTLTLRLWQVPWDQALDIVPEARDLVKHANGNVLMIAPLRELLSAQPQTNFVLGEPVRIEAIPLAFARAEVVRRRLTKEGLGVLSPRGRVGIDSRKNTLYVEDFESVMDDVIRHIWSLDVPPPAPV